MKSLCFRSWMATLSFTAVLLIGGTALSTAWAEEGELPPPAIGEEEKNASPAPPPQEEIGETLPEPGSGEEELPAPALGDSPEDAKNQVNHPTVEEDVFLPPPSSAGIDASTPLGISPAAPRTYTDYNESDWRAGMDNRPAFTMDLGVASRNYPTEAVFERKSGGQLGASYRVMNLGQTVFLHAYASMAYITVGDVVNFHRVKDLTYHFGGMLEVGVGRRLSLLGGLLFRKNYITADLYNSTIDGSVRPNPMTQLAGVGEKRTLKLGIGIQYDFYVIPHGSMGVRGYLEQDYAYAALTLSMEPAPRKRASLSGF